METGNDITLELATVEQMIAELSRRRCSGALILKREGVRGIEHWSWGADAAPVRLVEGDAMDDLPRLERDDIEESRDGH